MCSGDPLKGDSGEAKHMTGTLFTRRDIQHIKARGMTPEGIISQVASFEKGFPPAKLKRACTVGDGITVLAENDLERLEEIYAAAASAGRAMKFVPASGAASRMFKSLLSVNNRYEAIDPGLLLDPSDTDDADLHDFREFIRHIRSFAFYEDLKRTLAGDGLDIENLLENAHLKPILDYTLTAKGLCLAGIPKGLIPFHGYPDHARTPFEEHLMEAATYVSNEGKVARIHFTVSPEHATDVKDHLGKVRSIYERTGTRFDIVVSRQEPSTDTLAVDMDNRPFRDDAGNLVFRPGGHGALIENLDRLKGDIVFVKNIDNIVPDRLRGETVRYKMALGGHLLEIQDTLFHHIERLTTGTPAGGELNEIFEFAQSHLALSPPDDLTKKTDREKTRFLLSKLQRPLRVCGMVKNEGEPGGGPFWVEGADQTPSLQIIESSQVDSASGEQLEIWESSTHFNPVDLVCGLRDHQGRPFELLKFRDPDAGFISIKSIEGKEIKAMELPGLWNGAMAYWNTIFVEVPVSTFNPVKTVLDLLRKEHRQI